MKTALVLVSIKLILFAVIRLSFGYSEVLINNERHRIPSKSLHEWDCKLVLSFQVRIVVASLLK